MQEVQCSEEIIELYKYIDHKIFDAFTERMDKKVTLGQKSVVYTVETGERKKNFLEVSFSKTNLKIFAYCDDKKYREPSKEQWVTELEQKMKTKIRIANGYIVFNQAVSQQIEMTACPLSQKQLNTSRINSIAREDK